MFSIRNFAPFLLLFLSLAFGKQIRDFKVALMYYSEAYLQGATLGSVKLEGENSHYVAESICKAIDKLDIGSEWDRRPWKTLMQFKKRLQGGNSIYNEIERFGQFFFYSKYEKMQQNILKIIKNENGIVMPAGWTGHAIVLIIKPGLKANNYDLTVVNAGDGVGYHHHVADPNRIYPFLSRVWVEFKGIPESEIFSSDCWFVQGLVELNSSSFVDNVKAAIGRDEASLSIYFYSSFLANFIDYLVPVNKGKDIQIPMQRSGSCTISSIMGALLYESKDENTFYLYRNKIGNQFLNEVIKNGETDIELIRVITDGFDVNGRTFMKGLLSSMAHNVLKYLETGMPKEFKHAGLIGTGRSSWLYENKKEALNALKNNKEALTLIAETIKTSNLIINFLDRHRIRHNSTRIQVKDTNLAKLNRRYVSLNEDELTLSIKQNSLRSDVNEFIKGSPDRPKFTILTFKDFKNAFADVTASKLNNSKLMIITMDIFKANKDWSDLVETAKSGPELLTLQENIIKIVKAFSKTTVRTSFDDIVTLLLLEKLVWKCTVIYNEIAPAKSKMCKPNFNLREIYPKTLEAMLHNYHDYYGITANEPLIWRYHNIFDSSCIRIYQGIMAEYSAKQLSKDLKDKFLKGPESFAAPELSYLHFNDIKPEEAIKIFDHEIVIQTLEKFKVEERYNEKKIWTNGRENDSKAKIVLYHAKDKLKPIFPHYYNLMDALAIIQSAAIGRFDSSKSLDYWIDMKYDDIYEYLYRSDYYESVKVSVYLKRPADIMNTFWSLKAPYGEISFNRSKSDIFYRFRHTTVLFENIKNTSYQVWLNYIKDANNARIFDSAYFQYVTDRLLNNPVNYLNYDYEFSTYYWILDSRLAEEIIDGMINLIRSSLLRLHDNSAHPLTMDKRRTLTLRAANISVLLTRFISQLDLQNKFHGNFCAKKLAEIYIIMQPYSYLVSKFKLTSVEVSSINFAMFFICSTPIRNNKTFMESLPFLKNFTGNVYRKTLEKFHWFIANMNFFTKGALMGVVFDQFSYGMLESPLNVNETGFMEYLLKIDFIPSKYADSSDMTEFKFRSDGFIVEINSSKAEEANKKYLMINLAKGTVVSDGNSLVSTNIFINSKEFQDFFKKEDLALASAGYAVEVAGISVYALPDFKGISYILVYRNNTGGKSSGTVTIHRKWNNKWYWAKTVDECSNFITGLNYNWTNDTKLFKRKESEGECYEEFLLYPDDKTLEPLITARIQISTGFLQVLVRGMTGIWTVLEDERFEKHIRSFAEEDFILAMNESGRIVAIYPGLRLPEDPERPLVLEETKQLNGSYDFIVRNVPIMKISGVQSIGGVYSIPGALVSISESKKVLLLPLIEVFRRSKIKSKKEGYKKLKQIQKIPIIDDVPTPQARMHKLLLAYYLILAGNYKPARELLNPTSSLQQNEPFNDEELEILTWIIDIKTDALETTALKLVVIIHTLINVSKFPIDYENRSVENVINPNNVGSLAFNHLLSIRELSEKFYIYRIFPEVLREPLFTQVFSGVNQIMNPINITKSYDLSALKISFNKTHSKYYQLGKIINLDNFVYFLNLVEQGNDRHYLQVAKRLMHKSNDYVSFSNRLEMLVYCMVSTPEKFSKLKSEYNKWEKTEKPNYSTFTYDDDSELITKCFNEFEKKFQPVNQSLTMTKTPLNDLKKTMIEDFGRIALDVDSTTSDIHLVTDDDIDIMKKLREALEKIIKNDDGTSGSGPDLVNFKSNAAKQSKVLKSLIVSIKQFITEKGKNRLIQINLSEHDEILKDFDKLNNHFKIRLSQFSNEQNEAITELNSLANSQIHSNAINSVISLMHNKKSKTFNSLYSCYLQDSLACVQRKFPQLSLKTCLKLREDALSFFSRQILIDYFTMLSNSLEGFLKSKDPASAEDLTIFCDELAKIEKFNERVKDPVIMNFEFRSRKYRLRAEQVNDIDNLTKLDPTSNLFLSVVIQRMMAAGKTLVLGTISIIKKARDQARLSILVPPSSLYQSNTTAMQARTYQYFKRKGRNFSFPRFSLPIGDYSTVVKKFLENIIDLMEDSMRTQNYMILSPDTLHSYLNSYIEVLLNAEDRWDGQNYQDILRLYAEIYRIFKTRSSIILDEIDMTMDPRKELNFPTQETEPYNMVAAALLADIMEFLVFDEEVIKAGLDIHGNNQASLTPENYEKCRNLILKYIKAQLSDSSSLWNEFVCKRTKKPIDEIAIFLDEKDMAAHVDWIDELYTESHITANSLIIIKAQIYLYMEDSLKGTVNQNFGAAGNLRPEIKYAVPYVAANTPSPASVFADRWETLLKTLLMISSSPCSFNIAKEVIIYAKTSIMSESSGNSTFETTTTFNNLKLILPSSLNPILLDEKNDLQVEIVRKALALRSPAAIRILFSFYINQVFSKMTFPIEQITSNALHMASMFGSVQGYSGTIDNVNILPQCVVADAYEDHEKNEKNNGGISLKLIRDCNDEIVPELHINSFKKSIEEMVKDMLALCKDDIISHVSAIIDTGAFFKNFKNRQVAEAVLTVSGDKFEAGLYYDEDSNQLEYIRKSGSSFSRGFLDTTDPDDITKATQADLSKRFTFYDQRHITGSDILQPKTAHALMTAGPRVLLRDILQGTLRMRQFMTSQKVHLVTTEASRVFYYSKINDVSSKSVKVSDILALGALNEDDKQESENEKLAFAKIGVEVRGYILDEISRILADSEDISDKKDEVVNLFNCAKIIFLRFISEEPRDWLQRKEKKETAETLKVYAITLLRPLEHLITDKSSDQYIRYNSMKKRIKTMIDKSNSGKNDSLLRYLDDQINTRIQSENGTEVQMQTLTLTLIELNIDQLIDKVDGYYLNTVPKFDILPELENGKNYKDLEEENDQFVNFNFLFENQRKQNNNKDQIPLLDVAFMTKGKRIGITRDLIELLVVSSKENRYPIFSKYTLEGSHFLVQVYDQKLKILLISPKHASEITTNMFKIHLDSMFWLCDLSGTVSLTNNLNENIGQNILNFIPEAKYLIFDLLVYNGSLQQILANPILKNIYENEWLKADTFKERATFLLLRMKILLEKDLIMFEEDDEDLSNLKKFAMGNRDPTTNGSETFEYPKQKVQESFEKSTITRLKLNSSSVPVAEKKLKTIIFDLCAEIRKLFQIAASNTSHLKTQAKDSYKLIDKLPVDKDNDTNAETHKAIIKQSLIGIKPHSDDKAPVKVNTPVKNLSRTTGPPVGPALTEIIIDNIIDDYKEPDLSPVPDIFSKKIKINTSSLTDVLDAHDSDIKIDQLLPMDNIDLNTNPNGPDENIDDDPPQIQAHSYNSGGSGYSIFVIKVILSIIGIAAIVGGYFLYNRNHEKVEDIEDNEHKNPVNENQPHYYNNQRFFNVHGYYQDYEANDTENGNQQYFDGYYQNNLCEENSNEAQEHCNTNEEHNSVSAIEENNNLEQDSKN